ncbi:MAG TPA: glycosyltransferase family 9 protein [Myxococcota bacterium]|nr:glycosyltransferase family 9 protein [Myxococcota bacterium]HRY93855.1 glycosyltransferase family 9 protein [Myxococcota bacterium]HSA24006.1 glycosyltransferase family 9 protein [Myxococcota bacterium]
MTQLLVIRLSSVGDILLASPVAGRLRLLRPEAHITWLVDEGYQALLAHHPAVDRVVAYDYLGRHRGPAGLRVLCAELGAVEAVYDLQHKLRSSLVCAALRPAARRVLVKRRGLEVVRALLGHDTILRGPHQVERNLSLLDGVGEAPLPVAVADPASLPEARAWRRDFAGERPAVGLVVGARHATKRWPREHWSLLAARCLEEGLAVALLGGPEDADDIEALRAGLAGARLGAFHAAGLAGLMARLACLDALVCPDSGPAHLAAALGRPVVALFGPTSPERWAPRGPAVAVARLPLACSPCSNHGSGACPLGTHECMRALGVETVHAELAGLLAREGLAP